MPLFSVLQDRRDEVADTVNDAPNIDADHKLPVGERHLDQFGAVHRHAGIVAGDVEFAEIAFGFRQGIENRLLLRDIDPHRHNSLVRARETVGRLFDRIFLDVSHDHVGAGLSKRGCNA